MNRLYILARNYKEAKRLKLDKGVDSYYEEVKVDLIDYLRDKEDQEEALGDIARIRRAALKRFKDLKKDTGPILDILTENKLMDYLEEYYFWDNLYNMMEVILHYDS